ncbi:type II toxin-antitoxin system ParD family antitoxin [Pseudanabaena sp. PCC 6802]|uniref:ribbon-helix-helix domain-containing protein n=1 Tax=Pseudanabaena sp. PCC 6802 TaxID=118173 RepID=UPI00034C6012|nr:type II toxin-antitoxin system ParD family antitoxin [Pseudanabaena sp. PCC 6802]
MSISLPPAQEHFIQSKIQAGKYRSAEEVLEILLRLLDEYDRYNLKWVEDTRRKIEEAVAVSNHTAPIDGETFVHQILERFQRSH